MRARHTSSTLPRPLAYVLLILPFFLAACDFSGSPSGPSQAGTPTPIAATVAAATQTALAATATVASTATPAPSTATTDAPSATPVPVQATDTPQPTPTVLAPSPTPPPPPSDTPVAMPTATSAAQSEAVYVFPVQPAGVTSFVDYHHDYPATDIMCPVGSRFVAPTNGVVDYVSTKDVWDPNVDDGATRGGLSVAIIGDDGVRYYGSHLSAVQDGIVPGVRVKAGQILGKTGHSGDARYTDPHLHFGISHPTTPTDWKVRRGEVDPYKYLRAWEAGKLLRPLLP